ncbi:MAG: MgtC family magnesium (Mg2+) transporter [Candidatus Nomurabacteria bacterium GW2011_GWC2_41_8]|uniref:MgtC family magnesium (Mg2+) transporter n=3 Tax=Candidatus Nomuraibacteriota TaxID=1752729 RepID=A0A0G0XIZ9_9BACT|nr:MAG: MgtC family magnesium (Mg2+) transporter [Candidatus Nomurabacteria bacterium GW2011_GWA2_41_25]KKS24417.1 MAG: MgtC family magnesium (Mg2+) transporter [Candidatus Nomurabacteria bacterium GW2011_GWC2_41_8]
MYDISMTQFFAQNSEIIIRLLIAGGLGLLIGGERLFVHKEAGMKTHALVSMGSALFVIISEMIAIKYSSIGGFDPTRIASQIIVGIGFLGAGSIMLQGSRLKGLTTASGLWVTAGIGMAAGFGFFSLAVITMVLVLFVFVVVNKFEKPIRKISENSEEQDFN